MSHFIFYRLKNTNDLCYYLSFTPKDSHELQKFIEANTQTNMNHLVLKKEELPNVSVALLGCHRLNNNTLILDIENARETLRKRLRKQREKLFAPLDGEYMKALEDGDTVKQQEVVIKKRKLRDATKHDLIENAKTLEDLHAININTLI